MATFTWIPDQSPDEAYEPRVRRVNFGDGYAQRVTFGLNSNPGTHTLEFSNREPAEANAIMDFLRARNGVESFDWTPPWSGGISGKYVCARYARKPMTCAIHTVTATFEQVYEP